MDSFIKPKQKTVRPNIPNTSYWITVLFLSIF